MTTTTGYDHADAFDSGHLAVGSIHKIFYHQYGKPDGKPVIFLHGGPGAGTTKENTKFFNPAHYRVVLLDQRGAGKSTPVAEIRENTTQLLVQDIETLRQHLGIEKWFLVFGGSWGSTLSLAYAETHPQRVSSLILRGIFTVRDLELGYGFTPLGSAMLFPENYERLINYLPPQDRADPAPAYAKLLCSDDPAVRIPAAKVWNLYEMSVSSVDPDFKEIEAKVEDEEWSLQHGRLEAHYFINKGFLGEGQLLREEEVGKIRHIPCTIIQGRLDFVCPPKTAWDLHKMLPDSKLFMIPKAGHSAKELGIFEKLVETCDEYASKDF
ncbi:hypothetical protein M409DRAFT_60564 [Zasmidium cellare ATCC 36951]|uniref:Proline iminopeptidase n=1 Tax=Zasmidium cellare ATCC 36951 TaxID=1080233 RepID=A0A6A6C253_ZASCE|nr:uncharacterized protein M409DRAFT_60564 [Zasmidium cellare ATCC 36951]KAF2159799.1 hypothetical protein M409DRAFT_60564 [Zasmidium cellare ATCC 36951]